MSTGNIIRTQTVRASMPIVFLVAFLLGAVHNAEAMVVRWGETHNVEPYALVDDDLYVFTSKMATIQGTTTGDVLVGAIEITQTGAVLEDALMLGGIVHLHNTVVGDLRVVGHKIIASSTVGEDAVLIGTSVFITKDALIEGDLLVFGDYVHIEGTVNGHVRVYARTVELLGTFQNGVEVDVKESLSVTGNAHIEGDLRYSAPRKAFISETVTITGEQSMSEVTVERGNQLLGMGDMYRVLVTVFVSLLLVLLFPAQVHTVTAIALAKGGVWRALKGFGVLVLTPLVVALLILTIIGALPALILLFSYITVLLGAVALAPIVAGVALTHWAKKEEKALTMAWVSLGAIAFFLIAYVPILGPLVQFAFFLLALHAILAIAYEGVWKKRKGSSINTTEKSAHEEEKHNKKDSDEEDSKTHSS